MVADVRTLRVRSALTALAFIVLVGACGRNDSPAGSELQGTVTVYAARSLTAAFIEIGDAFEAANPGVHVDFNFAGSSTLVNQIVQGAPADVFASADRPNMDKLVTAHLVDGTPTTFTRNALQIVVAKANPKGIAGLRDLARAGVTTVLCAESVPCGNYARQALGKAAVSLHPTSDESSVAGVIGRVQNGEADAGIVYVTDVKANDAVAGVVIPPAENVVAEYPHALLRAAPDPRAAQAFRAFVEAPAGQRILAKHGFLPR
jgi:molybdate transport system substrate-binding protein